MYNTLVTLASSAAGGLAGGNAGAGAAFNEVTNNDLKHQSIDPKKLAEMNGINPLAISPNGAADLVAMTEAARKYDPGFTFYSGMGGNLSYIGYGKYVEDGIAYSFGMRSGFQRFGYSISADIFGPQGGVSYGAVFSLSPSTTSAGKSGFVGLTSFGGVGVIGNITATVDTTGAFGVGRASSRFGLGEAMGGGMIYGTQSVYSLK